MSLVNVAEFSGVSVSEYDCLSKWHLRPATSDTASERVCSMYLWQKPSNVRAAVKQGGVFQL